MKAQGFTKPMDGPLMVKIRFGFPLPKSQHRKTPKPMMWHIKRPDLDNLYKGVIDAMEGIVYFRDSEIVKVVMDKVIVAQGEAPYVNLVVMKMEPLNP
jgi:Holliday junction resolvase RusA-like endonuclease